MKLFRKTSLKMMQNPYYRFSWANTYIQKPGEGQIKRATMIPGVGIGPEICSSVSKVFQALNVPVKFDVMHQLTDDPACEKQLRQNEAILIGVLSSMKGSKYTDPFKFYQKLNLYAEIVTAFNIPGIKSRHKDVDIVVIRENTQGEYTGIEHEVYPGVIESIKVTTKEASLKVARYAFEFAHLSGRQKVTAVHKANIMKLVDGLFLEACREVAKQYKFIKYEEMIIDNCSMQLVKNPKQFDVMVLPNLYGSIVANICAGISGGVGITPGACVGDDHSLFQQGTRHAGLDIAGENIANPTAILYSSAMMLRHMNLPKFADKIVKAINIVLLEGKVRTRDLGGKASTEEYTQEVIEKL